MPPTRLRFPLVFAALAAVAAAPAAFALTVDAFTDTFPPNACPPHTGEPVIFTDPDCIYAHYADQAGLQSVLAGASCSAIVYEWNTPVAMSARVRTDLGAVEIASGGGDQHSFRSTYAGAGQQLDLDLTALGVAQLEIGFAGDVSPALPLTCRVRMGTVDQDGYTYLADLTMVVSQPGTQVFPLALFTPPPGFSFAEVDIVRVEVGECSPETVCDGPFPPRAYSIGPLHFVGGPTAAAPVTWGRLKTTYR